MGASTEKQQFHQRINLDTLSIDCDDSDAYLVVLLGLCWWLIDGGSLIGP